MREQIKALREKNRTLYEQMQGLNQTATRESRALTSEEAARWDQMDTDYEANRTQITRLERQLERETQIAQPGPTAALETAAGAAPDAERAARSTAYSSAFWKMLRQGVLALNPEERDLMASHQVDVPEQARALGVTADAGGATLVPDGFQARLEVAMAAVGGLRQSRATAWPTSTGGATPWPTTNDTSNEGELIGEDTEAAELDPTFGAVNFDAYIYSSKLVRASMAMLQDSAFDIEGHLADQLGRRVGRVTNRHFTVGTGTNQPRGVVTAAAVGKVGTTGQTVSVIYDDLVDLEHSVDPDYRSDAEFMMHDGTLKIVKKLKDSQGRPLWLPGMATKEPDTLLGYPFVINQHMAQMAANAKSIVFGDMSKYVMRDVKGFSLIVLKERFATKFQVGFLGFSRHDGDLVDAGTSPVRYYQNSAT
jgi:HK97 family phage major capsid protein